MIRTIIVDDELHAREELASLLCETELFEIVGSCGNAIDAIKQINRERPQVLFLDIQMPALDGFELLSMIDEQIMPLVVFVTAYDEYALKAFEEKTLDYLLKPVEPERLAKTIGKLQKAIELGTMPRYETPALDRIPCLSAQKIKLVGTKNVEYAHSDLSGVHIHTDKQNLFTELTLKVLEDRAGLLRCHKQYLVNMDHIDEITLLENGLAEIRTRSGQKLPVSRRYLRKLKENVGI